VKSEKNENEAANNGKEESLLQTRMGVPLKDALSCGVTRVEGGAGACGGVAPYSLAGNGDIGLILESGARLCVLGAMIENIRVFRSCRG
jgi:hypothetical protein